MNKKITSVLSIGIEELQKENAFLLPIRLFIGLGWMRAFAEKLIDPAWLSGEMLTRFLADQLASDLVYFPFYTSLIENLFMPNVSILLWVVMIGQLLAGIGIMTGSLTRWALVGGLFMNFNFVLAGAVNPSAFYILIQITLLAGGAGKVFSVDSLLPQYMPTLALPKLPKPKISFNHLMQSLLGMAASITFAGYAVFFIRDTSPHSVDDPAMLLFIISLLTFLTYFVQYVRGGNLRKPIGL